MSVIQGWRCWLMVGLVGLVAACASMQRDVLRMAKHPADAELGNRPPVCTECHAARDESFAWVQFNHTTGFDEQHKRPARQHEQVCAMCHTRRFCSDCHAAVELKPSWRHPDRTSRRMQHRGDYLARHRVEGRVNPTSCFRCHGNPKKSKGCVKCHG